MSRMIIRGEITLKVSLMLVTCLSNIKNYFADLYINSLPRLYRVFVAV